LEYKSLPHLLGRYLPYILWLGINILPMFMLAQSKTKSVFETGQFRKENPGDLADVTRIITEDEIRQRGANNLKDILMMETGGIFNYNAQSGWQFQWQGSTKGNILVLIDGLPFRSVQFDELDWQQIPLDNISRIEISENPMGVAYGSSAIMGVINIISKATQQKMYKPTFRFQGYNPGSFYNNVNLGRRTMKDYFRISSSIDAFAGRPGNDSGRVLQWLPYTRVNNHLFYSRKLWQAMDISFGLNSMFDLKTQLGYPIALSQFAMDRETRTYSNSIYSEVKGKLTKDYHMQGSIQFLDYRRNNTLYLKDLVSSNQEEVNDTALNDTIHYSLIYSRWVISSTEENTKFNYQLGFDISTTKDQFNKTVNNLAQSNSTSSLFFTAKYKGIKNTLLYGGLRLPYSAKYKTKPLWDMKVIYKFTPNVSFKFMFARSTKAPNFDQLFATYLTNGYTIKRNLNLRDESALSYHYSLQVKKDELSFEPGFFNYFFNNGIELIKDKNDTNRLIHKNFSKKTTIGTRINVTYKNKFIDINVRGTLTGNNYFANLFDRQLFFSEIYSRVSIQIPKALLNVSYIGKLTSQRGYMELASRGELQTYFNEKFYLADIILEKSFPKKTFVIRTGIKNIFDVKNISSFYLPVSGAIQPQPFQTSILSGRNYFIELGINL
jgi:outer membrane cobalamin receptor